MAKAPTIMATSATDRTVGKMGPTVFGSFVGILLLPFLFLGAALSFPYGFVANRVRSYKEKQLWKKLRAAGRSLEWSEFVETVLAGHGNVIIERRFPKGPERWWWTGDDVRALSPYPMADLQEIEFAADVEVNPAQDWCMDRYTDIATGKALLTIGTKEGRKTATQVLKSVRVIILRPNDLLKPKNSNEKA
jgi:hypothetical protein